MHLGPYGMKFFEPGTSNAVPVSIFSIHPPRSTCRVPYGVKCDVGTNNTNNSIYVISTCRSEIFTTRTYRPAFATLAFFLEMAGSASAVRLTTLIALLAPIEQMEHMESCGTKGKYCYGLMRGINSTYGEFDSRPEAPQFRLCTAQK